MKWNTHVSNICTKANRTLGFLRRNLAACPLDVKESAYKGLVRPILEYGSSVWDPQSILLQDELEKVQKRAARFVTGNYVGYETGSMTGILKQLKWESLKKRRKDSRLIMLYKGLKGAASIPTNDLVPPPPHQAYQESSLPGIPGAPVAQWVKRWPTDLAVPSSIPARGEIFSTVNGVPLHTAFHYHLPIVLI